MGGVRRMGWGEEWGGVRDWGGVRRMGWGEKNGVG